MITIDNKVNNITQRNGDSVDLMSYRNGGYVISISLVDGTKIRTKISDDPPIYPESMDIKITDYCDMHNICKWCHEGSDPKGKHGDLDKLFKTLRCLPQGVELAIGGGNPLSHPNLEEFLIQVAEIGLIANLTINEAHVNKNRRFISRLVANNLVKGIGVSYVGKRDISWIHEITDNVVYHMIAGINDVHDVAKLPKVLVLGYKHFRKGKEYYSDEVINNIHQWHIHLPDHLGTGVVSFDNVAIHQLKIRRLMTKEKWNEFYMGDDGTFTFYIDAVDENFAMSSIGAMRLPMMENCVIMFKMIREIT